MMISITNRLVIPPIHENRVFSRGASAKKTVRMRSNFGIRSCGEVPDRHQIERRSGNFKSARWDSTYVESINSVFLEERFIERASELKDEVKLVLNLKGMSNIEKLEFVDWMQKLGISYLFEEEIGRILCYVYEDKYCNNFEMIGRDLYSTSIEYRLLKQHGFRVSQDVFDCFIKENGDFDPLLSSDTKGLLELYEASFLSTYDDKKLYLARQFASALLRLNLENYCDDASSILIRHALEMPLHWRAQRSNARWFIEFYEKWGDHKNSILIELAKLDFNILQAQHQQELKHVTRWWNLTNIAEKLPFVRDRIVESYIYALGLRFQPQHEFLRVMVTKVIALVTTIDDIFDVYGTLEELHLFHKVIQSWGTEEIDELPSYMRTCFEELDSFVEEMSEHVMRNQGVHITPFIRKSWIDLCTSYMIEAEWYSWKHTPTIEEYINNAWISISITVTLSHSYFLVANPIKPNVVQVLHKYHNIVRYSGILSRIANDLATSMDEMQRGDVPKLVQCYMYETGASFNEARDHVKLMMEKTWDKLNEELVIMDSPFTSEFIALSFESARMWIYMYNEGDGYGAYTTPIEKSIMELLFKSL